MPRHDPVRPSRKTDYERAAKAWAHYKKTMKWMAVAAFVAACLSILYLREDGSPMSLHMIVATIAGVGLTVLVGTGLMGLIFLSSRSGHDDDAAGGGDDDRRG